jgi:hypothetical protein
MMVWDDLLLAANFIAAATRVGFRDVNAQIVEPLPLRNPPSAPAFSAAEITRGNTGISFSRNG